MSKMHILKNNLNKIIDYVYDKNDVVYIDYPLHHNVGDMLIYKGAVEFLKSKGVNVKLFRSAEDYDLNELKKVITSKTTILCHGGGNFGDLYEKHQKVRESLAKNFTNNRLVILPQTAHFSSDSELKKSISIFHDHNDLIMFARDKQTLDIFNLMSKNSFLLPDTAHFLYESLPVSKHKNNGVLYFLRKDIEINPIQKKLSEGNGVSGVDWDDFITSSDRKVFFLLRKFLFLARNRNIYFLKNIVAKLWYAQVNKIISRSSLFFSSHEMVITSRMHGHILSCLVNTKNKVIDNSYGKNSGYFNQWTFDVDNTELIKNDDEFKV